MLSTTASYRLVTRDLQQSLSNISQQPHNTREIEYYKQNIDKVKSIEDLLGDDRLYQFAMRAFGLDDMIYAKAFMRKVLDEGTDDQRSFANTLTDPRFREFAETFNFKRYGETTIAFDRTQSGTVDRFIRQSLEVVAGEDNQGVRLALYFERKAATINSAFDILGDRALLQVVRTALGLPETISTLDIDKQAALITNRIDVEDFSDPDKVAEFIDRFTSLWELERPRQQAAVPNILAPGPTIYGIDAETLLNLQNLQRGGR